MIDAVQVVVDTTLDTTYQEAMDQVVAGARITSARWLDWFATTSPDKQLMARVTAIWRARGVVPSPAQYDLVVSDLKAALAASGG